MKRKKELSLAEARPDLLNEQGQLDGNKLMEAMKKLHGGKDIVNGVYVDFSSQEYKDKLASLDKEFP
jgi:hypothetical protein